MAQVQSLAWELTLATGGIKKKKKSPFYKRPHAYSDKSSMDAKADRWRFGEVPDTGITKGQCFMVEKPARLVWQHQSEMV